MVCAGCVTVGSSVAIAVSSSEESVKVFTPLATVEMSSGSTVFENAGWVSVLVGASVAVPRAWPSVTLGAPVAVAELSVAVGVSASGESVRVFTTLATA